MRRSNSVLELKYIFVKQGMSIVSGGFAGFARLLIAALA